MQDKSTTDRSYAVEATGLSRRFGTVAALDDVCLSIRKGEFFSLLGPSGCGKTTLLRLIAGLDFPHAGSLHILQRDVVDWPAHQRPVNTVFQSYALFPHMTVRENVAFGLRMKKIAGAEIDDRVAKSLALVQITELARRWPDQISGGQKQRVALARALINEPKILLLDEPLGALDLKLRKQLQIELHQLQRKLGITFVYVTHDQDEALTMSDRIAVMDHGKIEQVGTPEELYERPKNRFVAHFLGCCNLIEGQGRTESDGSTWLECPVGRIALGAGTTIERRTSGVVIRPEKTVLSRTLPSNSQNWFKAVIDDAIYSGAETHYHLRAGGLQIRSCVFNSVEHERFKVGEMVFVHFPSTALTLLNE